MHGLNRESNRGSVSGRTIGGRPNDGIGMQSTVEPAWWQPYIDSGGFLISLGLKLWIRFAYVFVLTSAIMCSSGFAAIIAYTGMYYMTVPRLLHEFDVELQVIPPEVGGSRLRCEDAAWLYPDAF